MADNIIFNSKVGAEGFTVNGIDINNLYATKKELEDIIATGGDGDTKYELTKSGSTITLTGTDGSSYSVTDVDTHVEVLDSVSSTNTAKAASANSVKMAYDVALDGKNKAEAAQATADSKATTTYVDNAIANKADKTDIPDSLADLAADATHRTVTDAEKATWNAKSDFDGNYNNLTNKPTIPAAAKNGTLTIQKNGTTVTTFKANQSTNTTANITVPTKTSDITNDSGFITSSAIPSSLKNPTALTFGSKSYDGSVAKEITAADLGLSGAMKFLGTSTTTISDGSTTKTITVNGSSVTVTAGNVVLYDGKEFVWDGSQWEELGHEGSFKVKQTAVASPSASGSTTAFIDTISQDANGNITATKKNVSFPVTSVAGKTGAVTLAKSDVGLGKVENKSSATIRGELTSANVTEALGYTPLDEANAYTLPSAGSALGGVKSGGDVTISEGVITVKDDSHNHIIGNIDGLQSALDSKVPNSRTINGKALSANISLSASDVGAMSSSASVVKYTEQTLTDEQKAQARANIGAGVSEFSGSYNDLTNKPTIPAAAKNGTLTIQKNGTTVTTFKANQSSNVTANITVPTKTSDITNDSGFATETYVDTKVAGIVDSSPETLNTLNELAAALGDDPNFATTVATEIGKKVDKTTTVNGKALNGNISITKGDLGLGNVNNTADWEKSVNYAVGAGTAATADALTGKYTLDGGAQPPSYVGQYAVKCNMMNEFIGTSTSFESFADVLQMNAYGWGDVPYATAFAIQKTNGVPKAWIAAGGNTDEWAGATEIITANNIGSQSVNYASSAYSATTAGACTGNAATASAPSSGGSFITTNNIGSQSVNYANSAGSVAWDNVTGKPSEFTPSWHTHNTLYISDIRDTDGLPSQYSDNALSTFFSNTDLPNGVNAWKSGIHVKGWSNDYDSWELAASSSTDHNTNGPLCFRIGYDDTWGSWRTIIDSSNIGSQSVNYATRAGAADYADSVAWVDVYSPDTQTVSLYQGDRPIGTITYVSSDAPDDRLITINPVTHGNFPDESDFALPSPGTYVVSWESNSASYCAAIYYKGWGTGVNGGQSCMLPNGTSLYVDAGGYLAWLDSAGNSLLGNADALHVIKIS